MLPLDKEEWRQVSLDKAYTHDGEYTSDNVSVIQVDDVNNDFVKSVRAFVQLGDNQDYKFWVPVAVGDDYKSDWTDADVDAAVKAFFVNA